MFRRCSIVLELLIFPFEIRVREKLPVERSGWSDPKLALSIQSRFLLIKVISASSESCLRTKRSEERRKWLQPSRLRFQGPRPTPATRSGSRAVGRAVTRPLASPDSSTPTPETGAQCAERAATRQPQERSSTAMPLSFARCTEPPPVLAATPTTCPCSRAPISVTAGAISSPSSRRWRASGPLFYLTLGG